MSNTVLCIDTASPAFALALAVDGEVVESLQRDSNQDHSRLLLTAIDSLLEGRRDDLAGIIVVTGPGSYAGLRVGIATAEGLALSLSIPLAGVGTLEAVAAAAGVPDGTAIHPAGRGEFAAQPFAQGMPAGEMRALTAEQLPRNVAGEGAGQFGGIEVRPISRCAHALCLGLPRLDAAAGGIDAIYLREPHVTRPKRARTPITRG